MARPTRLPLCPTYLELRAETVAAGDENDCFPTSVAILTGLPLATVREAFAEAGRTTGKGTPFSIAREAIAALGYDLIKMDWRWMADKINSYPGRAKSLQNITTRHPARYPAAWAGESVMLHSHGHVSAVKDGAASDWSINRSKHVIAVYKIVKV